MPQASPPRAPVETKIPSPTRCGHRALGYRNTRGDAAAIGFDDDFIYQQIPLPPDQRTVAMNSFLRDEPLVSFREWAAKTDQAHN
ncbi:MAG: hypothetical protein NTX09_14710 [Verrucomicrobia bacterium]|nr:hypothetical protein [Verrucomicrobiota bacterium]